MSLDSSQDILNLGTFAVGWYSYASTVYTHLLSRIAYTAKHCIRVLLFICILCRHQLGK